MSTKRDKRAGHINGSADRTGHDAILGEKQAEAEIEKQHLRRQARELRQLDSADDPHVSKKCGEDSGAHERAADTKGSDAT